MAAIRHALMTRKGWLAWACALALAARMMVPTGYMPAKIGGWPAFELCPDAAPVVAMPDMHGMAMAGKKHDHARQTGGSCPFAIAAMAAMAGGEAVIHAAPLVATFIVKDAPVAAAPRQRMARLRPPAQGPPVA